MEWETSSLISIGPGMSRAGWGSCVGAVEPILEVVERERLGGEWSRGQSARPLVGLM